MATEGQQVAADMNDASIHLLPYAWARASHIRTSMNFSAEEGERNVRKSVDHVSTASSGNEKHRG